MKNIERENDKRSKGKDNWKEKREMPDILQSFYQLIIKSKLLQF